MKHDTEIRDWILWIFAMAGWLVFVNLCVWFLE